MITMLRIALCASLSFAADSGWYPHEGGLLKYSVNIKFGEEPVDTLPEGWKFARGQVLTRWKVSSHLGQARTRPWRLSGAALHRRRFQRTGLRERPGEQPDSDLRRQRKVSQAVDPPGSYPGNRDPSQR